MWFYVKKVKKNIFKSKQLYETTVSTSLCLKRVYNGHRYGFLYLGCLPLNRYRSFNLYVKEKVGRYSDRLSIVSPYDGDYIFFYIRVSINDIVINIIVFQTSLDLQMTLSILYISCQCITLWVIYILYLLLTYFICSTSFHIKR